MKKLLLAVCLLCVNILAQENVQVVNVPNSFTPVTFDVVDHNVGRGDPAKFDLRSNWDPNLTFNETLGYVFAITCVAGTDGINYNLFDINATLPFDKKWIINKVDVSSDNSRSSFSNRQGDTFGDPLIGVVPGENYRVLTATYTPSAIGVDSAVFTFTSNGNIVARTTVTFNIPNTPPNVSLQASPLRLAPGGTVAFVAQASDADGHAVTLAYDYGDGTAGTEAFRTYSTPGSYTVAVSAFDGFDTTTSQIQIEVVGDTARVPVPRFVTSDVVGFVGIPLAFDAIYTTDPQNSITSYSWNFGDGSAAGSGQQVSRSYTTEGSYLVTLTVTDGEGIQASTARAIQILPASMLGTFNAGVEFSTVFDRSKTNKDSLTVKATLNVGAQQVGDGTQVALAVAGQSFNAQLDRKLRASIKTANEPTQTWKVKFGVRKQTVGQVDLQITIKNADLGLGFNQLGALPDNDDLVEVIVPVAITIGASVFDVPTDAVFKFNKTGTRAKGTGESE